MDTFFNVWAKSGFQLTVW